MPLSECPECHASLDGMSSEELRAHREDHWPGEFEFKREHQDAPRLAQQLDREIDQRKVAEIRKQASTRPGSED